MKQFQSTVIKNHQIAEGYYEMSFGWPFEAGDPLPGQFCTIRVSESTTPLLRRPFAFSGYGDNIASIIYQKRGPATEILSSRGRSEEIDIIGPLGTSFTKDASIKKYILIAGGIGFGPMAFWAQELQRQKADMTFVFGCRSSEFIPDLSRMKIANPVICTDDGSAGFKGTTLDYMKSLGAPDRGAAICCCGPSAMLKGCHEFCLSHDIPCFVSLEQTMACGVGACMGCVVKVKQPPGYARVCKEGPVFSSRDIVWS